PNRLGFTGCSHFARIGLSLGITPRLFGQALRFQFESLVFALLRFELRFTNDLQLLSDERLIDGTLYLRILVSHAAEHPDSSHSHAAGGEEVRDISLDGVSDFLFARAQAIARILGGDFGRGLLYACADFMVHNIS